MLFERGLALDALAFEPAGWSESGNGGLAPDALARHGVLLVSFAAAGLGIGLPVLALSRSGRAGKIAA